MFWLLYNCHCTFCDCKYERGVKGDFPVRDIYMLKGFSKLDENPLCLCVSVNQLTANQTLSAASSTEMAEPGNLSSMDESWCISWLFNNCIGYFFSSGIIRQECSVDLKEFGGSCSVALRVQLWHSVGRDWGTSRTHGKYHTKYRTCWLRFGIG
jgi:hypothetical protein